jgi:sulfur dioxygenase
VLDTHVHADHVTAAGQLRARTGARTYASAAGAPCVDVGRCRRRRRSRWAAVALEVRTTPGHTDDSLSFVGPGAAFTGDALLIRGCGRADFQNGDPGGALRQHHRAAVRAPRRHRGLPGPRLPGPDRVVDRRGARWNPRLAGKSRDEFIALMNGLGLPPPKKLATAVPANRACGQAS